MRKGCDLKAWKSAYCLTVVAASRSALVTPSFQHSGLDQFSEAHCSHSVTINASRTFQQFSQISCTILNKPVNIHKLRLNVLGILMTATQLSLS